MNQKTIKLIKKVFGIRYLYALEKYKELNSQGKKVAKERMKLFINTADKEALLSADHFLSDVKLED